MYKFAHIADCHLGAFRDLKLREFNLSAFKKAMNICIQEKVDFIIIAGDLFDSHLPDTRVLNEAVKKMREVRNKGIEIYVLYGSHDFSPTKTSIIDVLSSAGLFKKITNKFIVDEKTGAKIVGIEARSLGLDRMEYKNLDRDNLEKESGFKIFVFHNAVSEIHPEFSATAVSVSDFPDGFSYYAGGHIHKRSVETFGNKIFALPGPLFGASYKDLENIALNKEEPGFFILEFDDDKITNRRFVSTKVADVEYIEYDATGKTSTQAFEDIKELVSSIDAGDKIILFRIKGELEAGNPSDIKFSEVKAQLIENGAEVVYINRNKLKKREKENVKIEGETREEIEKKVIEEIVSKGKIDKKNVELFLKLLNALKEENKGYTKADYERRILSNALKLMGLE